MSKVKEVVIGVDRLKNTGRNSAMQAALNEAKLFLSEELDKVKTGTELVISIAMRDAEIVEEVDEPEADEPEADEEHEADNTSESFEEAADEGDTQLNDPLALDD